MSRKTNLCCYKTLRFGGCLLLHHDLVYSETLPLSTDSIASVHEQCQMSSLLKLKQTKKSSLEIHPYQLLPDFSSSLPLKGLHFFISPSPATPLWPGCYFHHFTERALIKVTSDLVAKSNRHSELLPYLTSVQWLPLLITFSFLYTLFNLTQYSWIPKQDLSPYLSHLWVPLPRFFGQLLFLGLSLTFSCPMLYSLVICRPAALTSGNLSEK